MKWYRYIGYFLMTELAWLGFPMVLATVIFSKFITITWLDELIYSYIGYVFACSLYIKTWKIFFRQKGISHYYLIPVNPFLMKWLLHRKHVIPTEDAVFSIHVQSSNQYQQLRTMIQDMKKDVQLLSDFLSHHFPNFTLVGSTFTSLGSIWEQVSSLSSISVYEGAVIKVQEWLPKIMIKKHIRNMTGRNIKSNIKWHTFVIQRREKG